MCDEKLGCGYMVVRILLFFFNLIFWLCGILIIVFGARTYIQYGSIASLDIDDKYGWSISVPALIIAIGCVIFIVAFFGCCGAAMKNECLLYTFAVLLSLLFVLTLTGVIMAFTYNDKVKDNVGSVLNNTLVDFYDNDQIRSGWNSLQQDWPQCCGVNGPEDWLLHDLKIPESCCIDQTDAMNCTYVKDNIRSNGCFSEIVDSIDSFWTIGAGIAGGVLLVQLLGICMACGLARDIKVTEYEFV